MTKAILVLCTVTAFCARADTTYVSGTVNATWTREHSPYVVTGDVFVDQVLEIGPGVRVLFEQGRRIMFFDNGFLAAVGAEGDSIVFTTLSPDTDAWWGGLYFDNQVYSWMGYCVIEKVANPNHESDRGCGIRAHQTMMFDIEHSTMRHNRGGVGSAMYLEDGTHFITECDLVDNGLGLTGTGGAVWVQDDCDLYVRHSRFIQNHALDAGAIEVHGGRLYAEDSEFIENQAQIWGGAIFSEPPVAPYRIYMSRSVFRGNQAAVGGAVYGHCRLDIWYCLFDSNSAAQQGGALSVTDSTCLVARNTFVNNQAPSGGAIFGSGSSLALLSTGVFAYNTGGSLRNLGGPAAYSDFYQNSGDDTMSGTGNIFENPLFVDRFGGDYRLQWGSPCVDAGDTRLSTDPDSTRADMGCYFFDQSAAASPHAIVPHEFTLSACPNPFNSTVRLTFSLPRAGAATLTIFDVLGRKTAVLVNENLPAGEFTHSWNASSAATGVYFAVLRSGTNTVTQKLLLLK